MMSLVAYGSSDEDDGSEDDVDQVVIASKVQPQVQSIDADETNVLTATDKIRNGTGTSKVDNISSPAETLTSSDISSKTDLFSKLPAPLSSTSLFVVKDSIPRGNKSVRGPVKISAPTLPEYDDNDEPPSKKRLQQSSKGTKLTSMLPPPKGAFSLPPSKGGAGNEKKSTLVPNSVARKPIPPRPVKPATIRKPVQVAPPKPQNHDDSDDDSGTEDSATDFFSLTADHSVPSASDTSTFSASTSSNYVVPFTEERIPEHADQPSSYYESTEPSDTSDPSENSLGPQADSGQDYISFDSSDLQLDDEAIQRLAGRKGRRNQENVQIIDVNGDAIMPDSREWLTKQLTEERPRASSHRKKDGPSSQQRRKHQITYLAFQAKENELELQNQWANNRQSRRQTQSKYGF